MGERRSNRIQPRTDRAIVEHPEDAWMLVEVAAGRITMGPETRSSLRRLAREDVLLAGFGAGSVPLLLPRGQRLLAAIHGEVPMPTDD
jgi:hypothetical protein